MLQRSGGKVNAKFEVALSVVGQFESEADQRG
jgi:hypothetical protein